jgi:hypothetical protein
MYIRTTEEPEQGPLHYSLGDTPASPQEADRRFKRVAVLVTGGLKAAKNAIPHLPGKGQQALLGFMASLLDNFFPSGHGLIDARARVLRQSQKATVQVNVRDRDGALWPFEHRARLYLSDQIGFRQSGDHHTGIFSSIRLFTRALHDVTPSHAGLVALHEMIHMMFAMIRRFEQRFGVETAARLLARQPWRLLVLSGFAAHRERLERHVRDLLRVLPIPMEARELAVSLIEEAFAAMFVVIVDEAIARSSHMKTSKSPTNILVTAGFPPKEFLKYYVLERGFAVTEKQLGSGEAQQLFKRMTSDVDALAAALRAHLDS